MKKRVFNLVIVDESGSMAVIRKQAFEGLNETLLTVKKLDEAHAELDQRVTLISFDSTHTTVKYDNVGAAEVEPLAWDDYRPGGATPLYDAIGMGVARLRRQVGEGDHVLVTIITDGEENCSREYTLPIIKRLVEELKGKGWTFTLIGTANLDVQGMAQSMAIDNHLEFNEDAAGTRAMFQRERKSRVRFSKLLATSCALEEGSYFAD